MYVFQNSVTLKLNHHILTLAILSIGSFCFGQKTDTLKKIMLDHLKLQGKNPVYSIQTYISNTHTEFYEAVGFSDGQKEKACKDNQFKIASITKTMTATIILQMQEEKLLNINDKIATYLKDLNFVRVDELHFFNGKSYGNEITIKQLLQHRSGLADIFTDSAFKFYLNEYFHKKQIWSPEKLMNRYYRYNLNKHAHFPPDSGYYYSDVNYFLLGLIIEKISGQTLAQQFRKRIFEPLNMSDTYFEYYEPTTGNGKTAHSFLGRRDITRTLNTSYDWAGGGVMSTTADLTRFIKGIFQKKLFQQDSTIVNMTEMVEHSSKSGRKGYYGLGLFRYDFNDDIYYGHGGFWGAILAYCPSKNLSFCGNINQVQPPFDTNKFISTLLKKFCEP